MRKSTTEERLLGLDPGKYTQKPWNSSNYITESNPMSKIAQEMRIKAEQEDLLGSEERELTADEQAQFLRKKLLLMMGG